MIAILIFIFVVTLLMVVFPTKNSLIKNVLFAVVALALFLIAAFRIPGSDRDYYVYKYYWDNDFFKDVEISFLLIKDFLKRFLDLPILYLFIIYAFLGVAVKMKAIKVLSGTLFLTLLIYISNYFLLHELTQMRAGVAAGFFLLSLKYIYDRNLKMFLLLISLGAFFHYSAFMALPLYFLQPNNKNLKYYFWIIPLGFVLYFLKIDVIANIPIPYVQSRIDAYIMLTELAGEDEAFNIFSLSYLVKTGIFFLLYFYREKIILHNKYTSLLLKIYAISLFVFPLLATIPAFSYRVQSLFGVVDIILIPLILYLFKFKIFGYTLIILLAILFFVYNLGFSELIK